MQVHWEFYSKIYIQMVHDIKLIPGHNSKINLSKMIDSREPLIEVTLFRWKSKS